MWIGFFWLRIGTSGELLLLLLFIVYLTTLFQYLRQKSVDIGGKPAASAHFLLNPDSSAGARAI
jgi:hypothetical protein